MNFFGKVELNLKKKRFSLRMGKKKKQNQKQESKKEWFEVVEKKEDITQEMLQKVYSIDVPACNSNSACS